MSGRPASLFDGIEGVLLDIDDTLLDTRSAFARGLDAVAEEFLPHLDAAGRAEMLALWRADPDGYYRRHTRGELTQREQRLLRARQLHERFGGPSIDEAGFDAWNAVFTAGFEAGWARYDDAALTVRTLAQAGYPLGALTNAPGEMSRRKLERIGLADVVPLLVSLDTFGVGKPDARVFVEACRLLGTAPGQTLYVGDELDNDALAARAAGLRGVWLDRPGSRRGGGHLEDEALAHEAGVAVVGGLDELLWM